MLARRIVVCLDVVDGRVAKGVKFESLRDVGDPVQLAEHYEAAGADEVIFLDIFASNERRSTMLDAVRRTAERLFIPLTVGGGIRSVADVSAALRAGADKVSINSSAVSRPELLTEASARFGAQCVVASIDARARADSWEVFVEGGRKSTGRDAVAWAVECERRGAGEILLTSIDRDGTRQGFDIALTQAVSRAVTIPVVASGGAGSASDMADVLEGGEAGAALVAGILHDGLTSIEEIRRVAGLRGISLRRVA